MSRGSTCQEILCLMCSPSHWSRFKANFISDHRLCHQDWPGICRTFIHGSGLWEMLKFREVAESQATERSTGIWSQHLESSSQVNGPCAVPHAIPSLHKFFIGIWGGGGGEWPVNWGYCTNSICFWPINLTTTQCYLYLASSLPNHLNSSFVGEDTKSVY